jgi:hypothetical protein
MPSIRTIFAAAALALSLSAASAETVHAQAQAQAGAASWRGGRNEQLIDQAVRRYGYRPHRLTQRQVEAIHRAWDELLGPGSSRRRIALNRTQATAIVYMALVQPTEDDGRYDRRGRDGVEDRDGRDDGYGRNDRPGSWSAACDALQPDANRLGTLVAAPQSGAGRFVTEPDRGRARALARQIQERAVECRATAAADRAGEVMELLSHPLADRGAVRVRVDALKQAIQQADRGRR